MEKIRRYAAEHGFSAAYCFPPEPGDGAPEAVKTLVLLTREYDPGGRLVDHFYPASNAAYHEARKLGERLEAEFDLTAYLLNDVRLKPLCRRRPAFGTGKNTLNYLPKIGSRFCMELIGLSVALPWTSDAAYEGELQCEKCDRCLRACPTGAITESGFVKERCIRFHMMNGKPMPEEMRSYVGTTPGSYGIIGCDLCQRVCPANAQKERRRADSDDFTLEELLDCEPDTLARFAALYGKNYAIRNRIIAQALLTAANIGGDETEERIDRLTESPSALVADCARWAKQKRKNTKIY